MNDAPLPVYLVVHGLVMTGWYLLFLTQATLVSSRRMAVHRRLGVAGVVLAAAVVVTGAMVHLRLIPRMHALGRIASPEDVAFATGFVLQDLASLLPFGAGDLGRAGAAPTRAAQAADVLGNGVGDRSRVHDDTAAGAVP